MADLTVTAAQVGRVFPEKDIVVTGIAAEAITAGQVLFKDSNGKMQLADANAAGEQQARGIALEAAGSGQAVSYMKMGWLYGYTISQAYDAPIFLSDTVGALADAAGTLEVPVGVVDNIADNDLTKILFVDFRWRADYA